MNFKFDVNLGDTLSKLSQAQQKLANLSQPMQEAAQYMEKETKLNFAKQSTPEGAGWAGLAASTLARKSGKILHETGALVGSISVMSVSSTQATVGSSGVAYGIYHQMGTSKMPSRQFIGIAARHEAFIKQIFEKYIKSLGFD